MIDSKLPMPGIISHPNNQCVVVVCKPNLVISLSKSKTEKKERIEKIKYKYNIDPLLLAAGKNIVSGQKGDRKGGREGTELF